MWMFKLFINKTLCGSLQQIKINNNLINLKFMKLKNFNRLLFFAFILLFVTQSCVKEGPMGLAGSPGANGANGKDANTSCLPCHSTATMNQKTVEYQYSKHFYGTSSARNTKYCARCHTSDGFKEITADGLFVCANDIPAAERINCSTCHAMGAFDFAGDTASYILRTTTPVFLNYFGNLKAQDFGKVDNLCCTCHQIRGMTVPGIYKNSADSIAKKFDPNFKQLPFFPLDNTKNLTDSVKYQYGMSFDVHDGNQSNTLLGINGFEYPGQTYTRTWKHSDNTCIDCHMNQYNATPTLQHGVTSPTGGHTLRVNYAACNACHTTASSISDPIGLVQSAVTAKITELGNALVAKKLYKKSTTGAFSAEQSHDYVGNLLPKTKTTTLFGTAVSSNVVSPTTGLVVYGGTVQYKLDTDYANRIGRQWTYGELGAAYNYQYVANSSESLGVHNPVYVMQLLQTSIDYLNAH